MGVAGGISAYCSQSYPLTAGRFLIVDLVVGGIGSRLPLNVDLIISRSGNFSDKVTVPGVSLWEPVLPDEGTFTEIPLDYNCRTFWWAVIICVPCKYFFVL